MRNIIDLEMDKLLDKEPNNILETSLLEGEDLINFFFALLNFASNIPAKPLGS
jgi:hypothetical protein